MAKISIEAQVSQMRQMMIDESKRIHAAVYAKKLRQQEADYVIERVDAILETLVFVQENAALIKTALKGGGP